MKDDVIKIVGLCFALGCILVALILFCTRINDDEEYPTTLLVVEKYEDYVVGKTATGYTYKIKDGDDYEIGDYVSVIMYNNNTDTIEDDSVLEHRYSGFTEK